MDENCTGGNDNEHCFRRKRGKNSGAAEAKQPWSRLTGQIPTADDLHVPQKHINIKHVHVVSWVWVQRKSPERDGPNAQIQWDAT